MTAKGLWVLSGVLGGLRDDFPGENRLVTGVGLRRDRARNTGLWTDCAPGRGISLQKAKNREGTGTRRLKVLLSSHPLSRRPAAWAMGSFLGQFQNRCARYARLCSVPGRPSLGSGRLDCNASGYSNPETAIARVLSVCWCGLGAGVRNLRPFHEQHAHSTHPDLE